jgi:hypothetical protein
MFISNTFPFTKMVIYNLPCFPTEVTALILLRLVGGLFWWISPGQSSVLLVVLLLFSVGYVD